jgi:probable rRNA maturation factor
VVALCGEIPDKNGPQFRMIINRQKRIAIPSAALQKFLAQVRKELKLDRTEMSICFVTDGAIAKLKARYRGKRKPTDVLSFPAQANDRSTRSSANSRRTPEFLGDVAISPETARRNALRDGRALDTELKILMLHGTLHLLGYDHETDEGQMDRAEARLRRRLRLA